MGLSLLLKVLHRLGSSHININFVRTRPFLSNGCICGQTVKFVNSPLCACHGSTGQKSLSGLMTLTYQHVTAVLLLIYSRLF